MRVISVIQIHFLPELVWRDMQAAKLREWEAQGAEPTCNQALPLTTSRDRVAMHVSFGF